MVRTSQTYNGIINPVTNSKSKSNYNYFGRPMVKYQPAKDEIKFKQDTEEVSCKICNKSCNDYKGFIEFGFGNSNISLFSQLQNNRPKNNIIFCICTSCWKKLNKEVEKETADEEELKKRFDYLVGQNMLDKLKGEDNEQK